MEQRLQTIKQHGPTKEDIQWLIELAENWIHYQKTINQLKHQNSQLIKKTLTLPQGLNETAIENNINFSQTLTEALKKIVGLEKF